jgi:hypothetical protein
MMGGLFIKTVTEIRINEDVCLCDTVNLFIVALKILLLLLFARI